MDCDYGRWLMICKCGATATQKSMTRGNQKSTCWECEFCGREQADDISADLLNKRFTWCRVGWYQDTLRPIAFLKTGVRMYDLCLLRQSVRHMPILQNAKKYLHGLIGADGNMIINDEETR